MCVRVSLILDFCIRFFHVSRASFDSDFNLSIFVRFLNKKKMIFETHLWQFRLPHQHASRSNWPSQTRLRLPWPRAQPPLSLSMRSATQYIVQYTVQTIHNVLFFAGGQLKTAQYNQYTVHVHVHRTQNNTQPRAQSTIHSTHSAQDTKHDTAHSTQSKTHSPQTPSTIHSQQYSPESTGCNQILDREERNMVSLCLSQATA
jgi:hypothetical protein